MLSNHNFYGWQSCDGSLIREGPMKGKSTPNLNGEGRFLRGGNVQSSWSFQDDMVQDHSHSVNDPSSIYII